MELGAVGGGMGQWAGMMRPFGNEGANPTTARSTMTGAATGVEGLQECQTCKSRRYQDVSSDPSVSFQTPTKIAPGAEYMAVRGHEQEHVSNEQNRAKQNGQRVVSQTVTINTAICPECGRSYVAGGTTRTTTSAEQKAPATYPDRQQERNPGQLIDRIA